MQHALLDTMARQVDERCEARLAEARAQAEAILEEARSRAAKRHNDLIERTRRDLERQAERARQLAEQRTEQDELSMEQAVADEVLSSVRAELERVAAGPEFPSILEALLRELMTVAPARAEVVVPAAHAERCRAWLAGNGHAGVTVLESEKLRDGVAVQDPQRSFRVTNSLSSRFQKLENEARRICLQTLFGLGAR